jgi:hypothetical protein
MGDAEMFKKVEAAFKEQSHDRELCSISSRMKVFALTIRYTGRRMQFIVSVHERRDDPEKPGHFKYEQTAGESFRRFDQAIRNLKYHYRRA